MFINNTADLHAFLSDLMDKYITADRDQLLLDQGLVACQKSQELSGLQTVSVAWRRAHRKVGLTGVLPEHDEAVGQD